MLGEGPRLPALPHKQGRTQAGSEGGREAAGRQAGGGTGVSGGADTKGLLSPFLRPRGASAPSGVAQVRCPGQSEVPSTPFFWDLRQGELGPLGIGNSGHEISQGFGVPQKIAESYTLTG